MRKIKMLSVLFLMMFLTTTNTFASGGESDCLFMVKINEDGLNFEISNERSKSVCPIPAGSEYICIKSVSLPFSSAAKRDRSLVAEIVTRLDQLYRAAPTRIAAIERDIAHKNRELEFNRTGITRAQNLIATNNQKIRNARTEIEKIKMREVRENINRDIKVQTDLIASSETSIRSLTAEIEDRNSAIKSQTAELAKFTRWLGAYTAINANAGGSAVAQSELETLKKNRFYSAFPDVFFSQASPDFAKVYSSLTGVAAPVSSLCGNAYTGSSRSYYDKELVEALSVDPSLLRLLEDESEYQKIRLNAEDFDLAFEFTLKNSNGFINHLRASRITNPPLQLSQPEDSVTLPCTIALSQKLNSKPDTRFRAVVPRHGDKRVSQIAVSLIRNSPIPILDQKIRRREYFDSTYNPEIPDSPFESYRPIDNLPLDRLLTLADRGVVQRGFNLVVLPRGVTALDQSVALPLPVAKDIRVTSPQGCRESVFSDSSAAAGEVAYCTNPENKMNFTPRPGRKIDFHPGIDFAMYGKATRLTRPVELDDDFWVNYFAAGGTGASADNFVSSFNRTPVCRYEDTAEPVPTVSPVDGVVIAANYSCLPVCSKSQRDTCNNGRGNYVVIFGLDGKSHAFFHLRAQLMPPKESLFENGGPGRSCLQTLEVGQVVNQGTSIGCMGHTGASTAAHLHYQIGVHRQLDGQEFNPDYHLLSKEEETDLKLRIRKALTSAESDERSEVSSEDRANDRLYSTASRPKTMADHSLAGRWHQLWLRSYSREAHNRYWQNPLDVMCPLMGLFGIKMENGDLSGLWDHME